MFHNWTSSSVLELNNFVEKELYVNIFASQKHPHFFFPSETYFLCCTFSRREMRQKIVMAKSRFNLEEKYGKT